MKLTVESIAALTADASFIRAAELTMASMAMRQCIADVVIPYQKEVLAEGQWRVNPEYVKGGSFGDRCFEEDTVLLDPKRAWLMSSEDHAKYHAQVEIRRVKAGLKVTREGNCPLLEAEANQRDAEKLLIDSAQPFTGISDDQLLMNFSSRAPYIDLMLRMAAPKVRESKNILDELSN